MSTPIEVNFATTIGGIVSRFQRTYQVDETSAVRELEIPAQSTNKEITFAPGLYTGISFLLIASSGPLSIYANEASTGSPTWTMLLTASDGDCLVLSGAAVTALKGSTLTKLFATNASQTLAQYLTCLCGRDITP